MKRIGSTTKKLLKGMHGVSRDRVVGALRIVQNHLCAYMQPVQRGDAVKDPVRCDCKFGADKNFSFMSEASSGCPEVSQAFMMLAALSKKDFAALAEKAGVKLDR